MPTTSAYVGPLLLPIESAGANSPILDPTIAGLLAYFRHWIRESLNAKLAEIQGPDDSTTVEDACPLGNTFPWNHNSSFMRKHVCADDPSTPRVPLPGMWMWSEGEESTKEGATLWYEARVRNMKLHWIFPEVQIPNGFMARSGLAGAVGAAIHKACETWRHPTFTPAGAAAGASILTTLNLLGIEFQRGAEGRMSQAPSNLVGGNKGTSGGEGAVQRFFPTYEASIRVWERVGLWESDPVADALGDSALAINHGDSVADTDEVLQRILIAPDDLL